MVIPTLVVVTAGSLVAGYSIGQLYRNYNPGKKKIAKDLKELIVSAEAFNAELIPVKKEDLKLLSFNQTNNEIKKGAITTAKGIFMSIYQEPMVIYSFKRYFSSSNKNALLYARTSKLKYVFRTKDGVTAITANNIPIGELSNEGKFFSAKRKRQIAQIEKVDPELFDISIDGKEVANIQNPLKIASTNPNPRVFNLISKDIDDNQAILLLAIAILEMVDSIYSK